MVNLFAWTARITVDPSWVADGFDLTAEKLKEAILGELLRDALPHEVEVVITKAPDPARIRKVQGAEPEPEANNRTGEILQKYMRRPARKDKP